MCDVRGVCGVSLVGAVVVWWCGGVWWVVWVCGVWCVVCGVWCVVVCGMVCGVVCGGVWCCVVVCGSDDSEHAVSVQGHAYVQLIGWQNTWELPATPSPP